MPSNRDQNGRSVERNLHRSGKSLTSKGGEHENRKCTNTSYVHSPRRSGRRNCFLPGSGPGEWPVILLLHGFPTSSFQYRELIPRLADRYRVIAPDLPGFGFTEVPEQRRYKYSFDALASTVLAFTDALQLKTLRALCIRLRCAGRLSPGNGAPGASYCDRFAKRERVRRWPWRCLGPNPKILGRPTTENREVIRKNILTLEGTRWQYTHGAKNPESIAPESYTLDWALLQRPGNKEIQLDLFLDYASNVKLYPKFQEYFRKSKPPLLAIWGKNDPFFIPAGAEAFRRENPNANVQFLDTGHFALETHLEEIALAMRDFLRGCRTKWPNDQLMEPFMTKLLFITGISLLTCCYAAPRSWAEKSLS